MYQVQWAGVEARSSLLWISAGFDCASVAYPKFAVNHHPDFSATPADLNNDAKRTRLSELPKLQEK